MNLVDTTVVYIQVPFAHEIILLLLLNVGADEHTYHTNRSNFKMKALPG
jgi:hypothetical protein